MMATSTARNQAPSDTSYDRNTELKAFDDTKAGVKGLVDAGLTKIPQIFIQKPYIQLGDYSKCSIPVIDLEGVNKDATKRREIIREIIEACEKWGFFQVVNHGIPVTVLDEMIDGICRFHEQDTEEKKKLYTRDFNKRVLYLSNFRLYSSPAADWKDTLFCVMAPHTPDRDELPAVCRLVASKFFRRISGLMFPPKRGALIVNIGDLLQLITNDRLKSVHHRVVARNVGPRISVASFFRQQIRKGSSLSGYGPIKELI
ncbi:deacetoxyvindoline 4-hydroxylase-like [Cornus florida]|uniref:deacetoxyvindoline 4-hydroxylase-like n=1 Tax=Cornus florida TaxID=4283 RepID=UPI00289D8C46|nr:deacetoxyvindoline 4-hydroxylase-like [Cornus florida]